MSAWDLAETVVAIGSGSAEIPPELPTAGLFTTASPGLVGWPSLATGGSDKAATLIAAEPSDANKVRLI